MKSRSRFSSRTQPEKMYMAVPYSHRKVGKFRRKLGRFVDKNRTWIIAIAASFYINLEIAISKANAQIFKPAQDAMDCVVQAASAQGNNAIFALLPFIIFTLLTLAVFVYFVYTIVQAISSYGNGQEVTHIVQQPMFTLFCVILVFVLQSVLFGSAGAAGCG